MSRILKIITLSAIALLATAAVASASVNVTEGVGFAGKGDVQNALGLHNDAALQDYVQTHDVTFTYGYTKVYDNMLKYADGTEIHVPHVITGTRVVADQANTNKAGKVTDGWNLTGPTGAGINVVDDGGVETITNKMIENLATKGFPTEMRINHDRYSTFTTDGLQVDGHPLPNTPVEVAPTV